MPAQRCYYMRRVEQGRKWGGVGQQSMHGWGPLTGMVCWADPAGASIGVELLLVIGVHGLKVRWRCSPVACQRFVVTAVHPYLFVGLGRRLHL